MSQAKPDQAEMYYEQSWEIWAKHQPRGRAPTLLGYYTWLAGEPSPSRAESWRRNDVLELLQRRHHDTA